MKLSYLHLVEPYAARYTNTIARHGDSNDILIRMWGKTNPVSLNHGFDAISACKAIEKYIGILDIAVAMSAPFMSNPDLIYRIKRESPLCLQIGPSRTQLWTQIGIMYPFSDEWRAEQEARRRGTRFSITKSSMMEFFHCGRTSGIAEPRYGGQYRGTVYKHLSSCLYQSDHRATPMGDPASG